MSLLRMLAWPCPTFQFIVIYGIIKTENDLTLQLFHAFFSLPPLSGSIPCLNSSWLIPTLLKHCQCLFLNVTHLSVYFLPGTFCHLVPPCLPVSKCTINSLDLFLLYSPPHLMAITTAMRCVCMCVCVCVFSGSWLCLCVLRIFGSPVVWVI